MQHVSDNDDNVEGKTYQKKQTRKPRNQNKKYPEESKNIKKNPILEHFLMSHQYPGDSEEEKPEDPEKSAKILKTFPILPNLEK